jgi:HK97 gp10 family phage protein
MGRLQVFDITANGFDQCTKFIGSLEKRVVKAEDRAVVQAAAVARNAIRQQLSFAGSVAPVGFLGKRSGRLVSQVKVKYFRRSDGSRGASIKVRGDRGYIARFAEAGTKHQIARHMFATAWQQVARQVESKLLDAFDNEMKKTLDNFGGF